MPMQRHFHEELGALKQTLLAMGGLVEDQIRRVIRALVERDDVQARDVIDRDREVNAYENEIDEKCVELLALHQPAAGDLRFITTALKIVTDLERIGDQAVNIAESAIKVLTNSPGRPPADLRRIAELAERMTRDSLDSFVRKDVALARFVILRDDEVDRLKDKLFGELIATMVSDPQSIPDALSFILISRNLERIPRRSNPANHPMPRRLHIQPSHLPPHNRQNRKHRGHRHHVRARGAGGPDPGRLPGDERRLAVDLLPQHPDRDRHPGARVRVHAGRAARAQAPAGPGPRSAGGLGPRARR